MTNNRRFKQPEGDPDLNAEKSASSGDFREEDNLCATMVQALCKYSVESGKKCHGHFNIGNDTEEGVNVLFYAFPSSDFFFWFIEKGFFTLIAKTENKMKTLARMPCDKAEEFRTLVETVSKGMEGRNGEIH